jgi:hypothetical protein
VGATPATGVAAENPRNPAAYKADLVEVSANNLPVLDATTTMLVLVSRMLTACARSGAISSTSAWSSSRA